MAFRLSLAFCFLAALAVVLVGMHERRRRHDRMQTGDWIARANAAALSADDRTAAPILVDLLDDANPRVRMNALWALNKLTGLPWASRTLESREVWRGHGREWTDGRMLPTLDTVALGPSGWQQVGLAVRPNHDPPRIDVVLYLRRNGPVWIRRTDAEQYAAFLYRADGRIAKVLDDEEATSAGLELRLHDSSGNRVGRYWWPLDGEKIEVNAPLILSCETLTLSPGDYVAEVLLGQSVLDPEPPGRFSSTYEAPAQLEATRSLAVFRR